MRNSQEVPQNLKNCMQLMNIRERSVGILRRFGFSGKMILRYFIAIMLWLVVFVCRKLEVMLSLSWPIAGIALLLRLPFVTGFPSRYLLKRMYMEEKARAEERLKKIYV